MGTTAQKLSKILDTKEEIRQAINDMGVECDTDIIFAEYPDKIRQISGGGVTPSLPSSTGWYGISFDITVANSACTRIGSNMNLHVTLPIQSKMRRCLLTDSGMVNYYLDENDSTKKEDDSTAQLDGTDGQVMVEIPEHYRQFEVNGNIVNVMLSEQPLEGFHFVPKCYRSAYQATIDRTITATPKLASVVNATKAFRGGNNTTSWDGTYRSLLGKPASNISLGNFRLYARSRGGYGLNEAGWNCDVYEIQKTCYWLYVIEYANRNCKLPFNAQPTMEEWKQGGLGNGTMLNDTAWNTYNAYNPFIPCGYTNSLGNKTGIVNFTMPPQYGTLTVQVPSYRGLENPFGHIWSHTDGCKCRIQSGSAGLSQFYVCDDPAIFQDTNYNDYELQGVLPRAGGYVKEMLIGEAGENMPKITTGASSTTYFSIYSYTALPSSGEQQRSILFGGCANDGNAGLACTATNYAASYVYPSIGSRLCFIP